MQITKAMELVAASKMRKASESIERSKPYFNILHETLEDIAKDNKDFSSVFTREREGKTCHIVIMPVTEDLQADITTICLNLLT